MDINLMSKTAEVGSCRRAFYKWVDDYKPKPLALEIECIGNKYGGRIDFIGTLVYKGKRQVFVGDWKTSKASTKKRVKRLARKPRQHLLVRRWLLKPKRFGGTRLLRERRRKGSLGQTSRRPFLTKSFTSTVVRKS